MSTIDICVANDNTMVIMHEEFANSPPKSIIMGQYDEIESLCLRLDYKTWFQYMGLKETSQTTQVKSNHGLKRIDVYEVIC